MQGRWASYAIVIARILLGAWMIINGLNHWFPIFPQPLGSNPMSSQLLVMLIETGLFGVVKAVEVVGGVMLILNRFVPLGLLMLLPVSGVVWYNAAILQGKWDQIIYMGTNCLYLNLVLMAVYFKHYIAMLRADAEMGTIHDLKRVPEIFANIFKYDSSKF